MEALLFVVDLALFIALLLAIRRNEGSNKSSEKLGWFSYIDDTRDVPQRQERRDA